MVVLSSTPSCPSGSKSRHGARSRSIPTTREGCTTLGGPRAHERADLRRGGGLGPGKHRSRTNTDLLDAHLLTSIRRCRFLREIRRVAPVLAKCSDHCYTSDSFCPFRPREHPEPEENPAGRPTGPSLSSGFHLPITEEVARSHEAGKRLD